MRWLALRLFTACCIALAGSALAQTPSTPLADSWDEASPSFGAILNPNQANPRPVSRPTWTELATEADSTRARSLWLSLLLRSRLESPERVEVDAYAPVGAHGHTVKAWALLSLGDAEAALAEAEAALACPAITNETYLVRASALRALGSLPEAEAAVSAYIDLAPWNPDAFLLRADLRAELGNESGSAEDRSVAEQLCGNVVRDPAGERSARTRPACDQLVADMGAHERGRWGRWCTMTYLERMPSLLEAALRSGEYKCVCELDGVPGSLVGWFGPDKAAEIILAVNRDAPANDPRLSIGRCVDSGPGLRGYLHAAETEHVRALAREAALPDLRLQAAAELVMRGVAPGRDDIAGLRPLTTAGWSAYTIVWTHLGNESKSREGQGHLDAHDDEMRRNALTRTLKETQTDKAISVTTRVLRRLREDSVLDVPHYLTDIGLFARMQLAHAVLVDTKPEHIDAARSQVARWDHGSGDLAIPPAPVIPSLDAGAAETDVARIAGRLLAPETVRQAAAELRSVPIQNAGPTCDACKVALLSDELSGCFEEQKALLTVIEHYARSEAAAYEVVYAHRYLTEGGPGGRSAVRDTILRAARELAHPARLQLRLQALSYAPEVFDEVTRGEVSAWDSILGRWQLDNPAFVRLVTGERAESVEAAKWFAEQGDPLGELAQWFWETYRDEWERGEGTAEQAFSPCPYRFAGPPAIRANRAPRLGRRRDG